MLVQCITSFPDIDIFRALLAKDRIDNVCELAINVVFYFILFTAMVLKLVRCHDVRSDCTVQYYSICVTVFPARLTSVWFRKEQSIVFFVNQYVLFSLLNASMRASVKICFILSDVCSFCMCFHRIRRMFGSTLEKVITSGTF